MSPWNLLVYTGFFSFCLVTMYVPSCFVLCSVWPVRATCPARPGCVPPHVLHDLRIHGTPHVPCLRSGRVPRLAALPLRLLCCSLHGSSLVHHMPCVDLCLDFVHRLAVAVPCGPSPLPLPPFMYRGSYVLYFCGCVFVWVCASVSLPPPVAHDRRVCVRRVRLWRLHTRGPRIGSVSAPPACVPHSVAPCALQCCPREVCSLLFLVCTPPTVPSCVHVEQHPVRHCPQVCAPDG
jgi:hypothetical protein